MLTFDEFVSEVLRELDIEGVEDCSQTTLLVDDLGLDSLTAYELIYVAEQRAGLPPLEQGPVAEAPNFEPIESLGDAYAYYRDACARARGYH